MVSRNRKSLAQYLVDELDITVKEFLFRTGKKQSTTNYQWNHEELFKIIVYDVAVMKNQNVD